MARVKPKMKQVSIAQVVGAYTARETRRVACDPCFLRRAILPLSLSRIHTRAT